MAAYWWVCKPSGPISSGGITRSRGAGYAALSYVYRRWLGLRLRHGRTIKAMFDYLLGYSPVHNVRAGTGIQRPSSTGDHDDRVVPAHSFKFAAHLQAKQGGAAPVMIRIEKDAGHGAGTQQKKLTSTLIYLPLR